MKENEEKWKIEKKKFFFLKWKKMKKWKKKTEKM